jgi:hypothetical protein
LEDRALTTGTRAAIAELDALFVHTVSPRSAITPRSNDAFPERLHMTQRQPYAPPADDGGGQGSFTRPDQELAQPNASDPSDREAAVSYWQSKSAPRTSLRGKLQSAVVTLLMLLMVASIAIAAVYCNAPR